MKTSAQRYREKLETLDIEVTRFLDRMEEAQTKNDIEEAGHSQWGSANYTRENGALKRASLDLSAALVKFRRGD